MNQYFFVRRMQYEVFDEWWTTQEYLLLRFIEDNRMFVVYVFAVRIKWSNIIPTVCLYKQQYEYLFTSIFTAKEVIIINEQNKRLRGTV